MIQVGRAPTKRTYYAARQQASGSRGLDPMAQAIRIVGDRALDTMQEIAWVLVEPLARDALASDTQALEQGRRLAGVLVDVGDDGLAFASRQVSSPSASLVWDRLNNIPPGE
jgi:hypothetical protein